jgi:hypothetical protein
MSIFSFLSNTIVYKVLSYATALLYFYLFYSLLFAPESFVRDMGLAGSETTFILARRAAMLMLGFAVLAFFGAGSAASAARRVITLAICVNMAGFATMSLVEYFRGTVNSSILQAAAIEIFLAVAYFLVWLAGKILPATGGTQ